MTDTEDEPLAVGDGLAELAEAVLIAMLISTASLSAIVAGGLYVYLHQGTPSGAEGGVTLALLPAYIILLLFGLLGLYDLGKDGYGYARRAWASYSSGPEDPTAATDGGNENSAEIAGGDRNRQQTTTKHN